MPLKDRLYVVDERLDAKNTCPVALVAVETGRYAIFHGVLNRPHGKAVSSHSNFSGPDGRFEMFGVDLSILADKFIVNPGEFSPAGIFRPQAIKAAVEDVIYLRLIVQTGRIKVFVRGVRRLARRKFFAVVVCLAEFITSRQLTPTNFFAIR
jgi:hypothetical protein